MTDWIGSTHEDVGCFSGEQLKLEGWGFPSGEEDNVLKFVGRSKLLSSGSLILAFLDGSTGEIFGIISILGDPNFGLFEIGGSVGVEVTILKE